MDTDNKKTNYKAKKYTAVIGISVMVLIIITTAAFISRSRLASAREAAKNRAYIAYTLLGQEVMLLQDVETAKTDISPESLSDKYDVYKNAASEGEAYISADITRFDDEFALTFFEYYDNATKTAFVYNQEDYQFDVIPAKSGSEYHIDKTEIKIIQ